MTMIDLIITLIVPCAIFYAGWKCRELYAQRTIKKYLLKADEDARKLIEEKSIDLNVEKHGDTFYVYNEKNGSFVTQVTSFEQLVDFLKVKYPDYYITMKPEHKALFES